MPRTHPPYAPEYRRRIIELARSGRPIAQLAREFEASANVIRKWVKQSGLDDGLRSDGLTTAEREELNRLRRENRVLREEREILSKPRPGSRRRPAQCRHDVPIVNANQAMYGVATMCRALAVSASGYYAWLKRPLSARARADAELMSRLTAIHDVAPSGTGHGGLDIGRTYDQDTGGNRDNRRGTARQASTVRG